MQATLLRLATFAVVLCAAGCGTHRATPEKQTISYAVREPGSDTMPTHETSFRMIAYDGPTRFGAFRALLIQAGNQCGTIKSAVLMGGVAGTDEWRVKCDAFTWGVWFQPDGTTDVFRCQSETACK